MKNNSEILEIVIAEWLKVRKYSRTHGPMGYIRVDTYFEYPGTKYPTRFMGLCAFADILEESGILTSSERENFTMLLRNNIFTYPGEKLNVRITFWFRIVSYDYEKAFQDRLNYLEYLRDKV